MANLDWSQCPAVEIPGKVSGGGCSRTLGPISTVFENLP